MSKRNRHRHRTRSRIRSEPTRPPHGLLPAGLTIETLLSSLLPGVLDRVWGWAQEGHATMGRGVVGITLVAPTAEYPDGISLHGYVTPRNIPAMPATPATMRNAILAVVHQYNPVQDMVFVVMDMRESDPRIWHACLTRVFQVEEGHA